MKKWFNNIFPNYARLSRSGKWLAWITFLQGISWIGVAVVVHLMMNRLDDWIAFVLVLCVGLLNLYASYFIFHRQIKGFRWAILIFSLAIFQVRHTDGFFVDLSGTLKLSLGIGVGQWFISLNFVALLFLWFIYKNIMQLKQEIHHKNPEIPIEQI